MKKGLIVQKYSLNRKYLEDAIEEIGFDVLTAESGKKGLEVARREVPDLVFIDTRLDDMEGYDLCRVLKQDKYTKKAKVFSISLDVDRDYNKKCRENGVDGCIVTGKLIEGLREYKLIQCRQEILSLLD